MKKIICITAVMISFTYMNSIAQSSMPQMGGDFRPSYESYRLDKFIEENEVSYSGNLQFSIPLLTVPGRNGNNFDIKIDYSSDVRQRQYASWVGLGWDLVIGAIERTVNGRADEPSHNCDYGSLGGENCIEGRGNMGGRFKEDFLNDPLTYRDVSDQYQLLIDGGGMQIIPFNSSMNETLIIDYPFSFIPIRYKPWEIAGYLKPDGSLLGFFLKKEDGTIYNYGDWGSAQTGQVEWKRVGDMGIYSNPKQQYKFPYRWNLNSIQYPDGSRTEIEYEFQNSSFNRYYRRYEDVMIDRSRDNHVGNLFGNLPPSDNICDPIPTIPVQVDSVYFEYAHPCTLKTDTHYLVFQTTSNSPDSTNRNCRLDALILYDNETHTELKRIVFHYAENDGMDECPPTFDEWETNTRLNQFQLTLIGFTIQNGEIIPPPEEPDESETEPLNYYFTYTTNPKVNLEGIYRYLSTTTWEWPGNYPLYTDPEFGYAWRLKTIILPTGGKYTFEYDTLLVNYDPEGNPENTNGWNYSSEPISRIVSKKFEDGFDQPKIWNYSYSPEVVYDPPDAVAVSGYVPLAYRTNYNNNEHGYYKAIRGCSVGHRWVQITNPDNSWKKYYFTSSYHGDPMESKHDYFVDTMPSGEENIIDSSYSAARGLIWKEESGEGSTISTSTLNYYSFINQGELKDRCDYFGLIPNAALQYTLLTSIWARLDSTKTTNDGVIVTTKFEYYPTQREDEDGNSLIKLQVNKGNSYDKRTSYTYAYSYPEYSEMKERNMRSQLYSKTISKGIVFPVFSIDDESKEFTTWFLEQSSDCWLPQKLYRWKGSSTDQTAPQEPTGNNVINIKSFSYDNSGFSNIINETDANGLITKYYYSDDINYPFINNTGGLQRGYRTGIEYPLVSPLLRESFQYDHYGNIVEKADENNNKTKATYDDLGRIISVIDPFDNEIEIFSYYLHSSNSVVSSSNPNSIIAESYRSLNDFSTIKNYYGGAVFERQKLVAFGDDDIITPTTYDNMWRKQKSYKTYQVNQGTNKHNYDIDYQSNAVSYYGFSIPYLSSEYYTDGTGRLKDVKPEGHPWQTHFFQYFYTHNINSDEAVSVFVDEPDMTDIESFTVPYNQTVIYQVTVSGGVYFCVGTTPGGFDIVTKKYSNTTGTFETKTGITYYVTSQAPSCPNPPCTLGGGGNVKYNTTGGVTGFPNATLFKQTSINENGIKILEYSDKLGNLIQSVSDSAGLKLITRFDNNVLGDMLKSIPPLGSSYATNYTYNTLSQLTQRISPDAGTINYLYDKTGNLRFFQDANQSPTDKFTYQKYDALNRLIEVGEYTASGSFTQTNADDYSFPLDSNPNKVLQKKFYYDNLYYTGQINLKGNLSKSDAYRDGAITLTTFFSYDEKNRVEWIVHQISGMSEKKINYWYDWQDNIVKKSVSDLGSNTLYTFYEYDEAGRLSKVFTNTIDSQTGRVQEAQYSYNADGTVEQLNLANAQTMDYLYNERSWLTQINHQNLYGDDKFGEVIGYNNQDHIATGSGYNWQPQYNGNISWNIMRTKGVGLEGVDAGYPDPIIGYVYNYDGTNRLTMADFGYYNLNPNYTQGWSNSLPKAAMYGLPLISYDANGNIFNLQRNGVDALLMDNFSYTYQSNKNRLASIMNSITSQTYNYGYDNNGNVTSDQFRDISGITYNISNLPEQLTANGSLVEYWYDNNGNRFRKQDGTTDEVYVLGVNGETEAVFNADGTIKFFNILSGNETIGRFAPTPVDLYLSNVVLEGTYEAQNSITVEEDVTIGGPTVLKAGNSINLKPGFTAPNGIDFIAKIGTVTNVAKRFYYLKDHLGSIRVVVNEAGEIVSSDDYDPWGMILNGRSTNGSYLNAKYKFTGKERDVETGYDYFGARYYDSRVGRWIQIDPLIDKSPHLTPYHYSRNNPLRFFDPDGQQEVTIQYRAFIPQESVAGFRGDNRTFSADPNASSRVTIIVKVETDPVKNQGNPLLGSEIAISPTHNNLTGGEQTSTGPQMPTINVIQNTDGTVSISVEMNMRNPYVPIGSGIRSDVNISVSQDATNAGVIGTVSGSPSFEANFSIDGGQNQNVPLQSAPTSTIGFIIGLQQTNEINKNVNLQQKEKKEENR